MPPDDRRRRLAAHPLETALRAGRLLGLWAGRYRESRRVRGAFEESGGPDHLVTQCVGRMAMGLQHAGVPFDIGLVARKYGAPLETFLIFEQAARLLYDRGYRSDLGMVPLGLGELRALCRSTSHMEAGMYLRGLCPDLRLLTAYGGLLRPGDTVVDVGANIGWHTLAMAHHVGAQGRVVAYEPDGRLLGRLEENLLANELQDRVVRRPLALSSTSGTAPFAPASEGFHGGWGRLGSGPATVTVATMDQEWQAADDLPAPALVKIDVEGHELEVVRGASRILEQARPRLLVEANPGAWSLDELRAALPWKARVQRLPLTYAEHAWDVPAEAVGLVGGNDLLITPDPVGRG